MRLNRQADLQQGETELRSLSEEDIRALFFT